MNLSSGIIGAGNWIVDSTKTIDVYPTQDNLANIQSEQKNNGGGAFNILVDLAHMGANFPLHGLGLIGQDSAGDWILQHCKERGIDTALVARHASAPTSYTDVMSVRSTGRRTFFHQRGANCFLGPEHFPWDKMNGRILYLGYLLLLDAMDEPDDEHGTVAAGILKAAGRHGLVRVVDLVSVERSDYSDIVNPSLHEIDVLICNEIEASRVTGIPIRKSDNTYGREGLRGAGKALLNRGVRDWTVIHLPEGAYARSKDGTEVWQGRVQLPEARIAGAAGAGDAFAAGLLFGLHEGMDMQQNLLAGVCAAAACITHATTSGGVPKLADCLAFGTQYGCLAFP